MGPKCADHAEAELRKSRPAANEKEKDHTWDSVEADFRNNFKWTIPL